MAKASDFAEEILRLRAAGESVRSIASKLGVPASSVHYFLKQQGGGDDGESKESPTVDQATVLDAVNNVALRLDELETRLKTVEERKETKTWPRGEADGGGRRSWRSRIAVLKAGAIVAGVIIGALSLEWSANRKTSQEVVGVHAEPARSPRPTKNRGIQVEIFHTPQYWMAVKWPTDTPSPLTRIDGGYRLNIAGLVMKFVVDESTSHGEVDKPVSGLMISKRSDVSAKIKGLCSQNAGSLDCGYLYEFIENPATWDQVVMAEKEPLTR